MVLSYVTQQVREFDIEVSKYNKIISGIMRPQLLELTSENAELKGRVIELGKEVEALRRKVQAVKGENEKLSKEKETISEIYKAQISSQKGENKFLQDRIISMQRLIELYIEQI